jgi:capsule polysaccharide export protein KpsE/RkpR
MTNVGMFEDAIKIEKLSKEIKKLKNQVREAQGELSIIKGIGNNSPEMKLLQKEVAALKQQLHTDNEKAQRRITELMEINKDHQQLNGKQHSELEIEKKNHTLCREGNDLLNKEIGRMIKKLSKL